MQGSHSSIFDVLCVTHFSLQILIHKQAIVLTMYQREIKMYSLQNVIVPP